MTSDRDVNAAFLSFPGSFAVSKCLTTKTVLIEVYQVSVEQSAPKSRVERRLERLINKTSPKLMSHKR